MGIRAFVLSGYVSMDSNDTDSGDDFHPDAPDAIKPVPVSTVSSSRLPNTALPNPVRE